MSRNSSGEDDIPAADDGGGAHLGDGGEGGNEYYEEGPGRPFFMNPALLASLALLLIVDGALGWGWATFDGGHGGSALDAPREMAALPPPPMPSTPEPAAKPAPDPELVTEGENGPLPVIALDGRQPWQVYARPFELPADTPRIAIIIGGLGLSRAATQAAIQQLPGAVTLAFVPYAPDLGDWIAAARAAGHEVVLQLPMEPQDYPANDPGPHTLLASAAAADNLARLDWLLSRFTGYVGVTNYMGGRLTSSPEALRPILEDLSARGLLFLDSRENPESVAALVAAELEMPRVVNNRFLDVEASRMSVDARLLELERIAESTGAAVGIGFLYPVTIERVAAWIRELESKGIALAPITAVATTQPRN